MSTATLAPTFEVGDQVSTYTSGHSRPPIRGTVEAVCPTYGVLVVDRSLSYPRGGWFLPNEVEHTSQLTPARRAAALRGWDTRDDL